MPLAHLARGYARLASGARDAEFGEGFALLGEADRKSTRLNSSHPQQLPDPAGRVPDEQVRMPQGARSEMFAKAGREKVRGGVQGRLG